MKNTQSVVVNLLISATLFWPVPPVEANQGILRIPDDTITYCGSNFPPACEESLASEPFFPERFGSVMAFYDPCQHDPLGPEPSLIIESSPSTVGIKRGAGPQAPALKGTADEKCVL
jgi:hypothetical protein